MRFYQKIRFLSMTTFLIDEDDLDNMENIHRFSRMKEYDVYTATNGPGGVAMALAERPDLILMDLGLPNPEDGLKATLPIRAQDGTEDIPVIAPRPGRWRRTSGRPARRAATTSRASRSIPNV